MGHTLPSQAQCAVRSDCLVNTLVLLLITGGGAGRTPRPQHGRQPEFRRGLAFTMHRGPTCPSQRWFSGEQARAGRLEDEKQAHTSV